MKKRNYTYEEALEKTKLARSCICPNFGFAEQLRRMNKNIDELSPEELTSLINSFLDNIDALADKLTPEELNTIINQLLDELNSKDCDNLFSKSFERVRENIYVR